VTGRELRPKLGHDQFRQEKHHEHDEGHHEHHQEGHGHGRHAQEKHERMMANLGDCQVLLCGGMGMGAHERLREIGITPVLTGTSDIQAAVNAYVAGTLENEERRLH
jgi:predicted Fe-Mo cluster-binding NifX family protein